MPELPEMQALAERLDDLYRGSTFGGAQPLQFAAAKTFDPPVEALVGRDLVGVGRRAKYLVFDLGGPRLLVHLSQGGRVDIESPPKRTRPKIGVVRLLFDKQPSMLVKEFGTQRKAGWWVLAPGDDGPLARLGPEPGTTEFRRVIEAGTDKRRIHTVLRDQKTVAGIGRGYSDDILHEARLSPYTALGALDAGERTRLLDAVDLVLDRALAAERKRTGGLPAKLDGRFVVHGHNGDPCPRCAETLRRVSFEDYEITYCPACQTGGKVLADRRLSRLIK
jgi:formamidopyrimidine-DNA glycosylase